jgi:2,5-diketo-D-gluconate reductase B
MEQAPSKTAPCAKANDIPVLGVGTDGRAEAPQYSGPEQCYKNVVRALNFGYRHVDTAQLYGNEEVIGRAIADSNVQRDNIFVATKIRPANLDYNTIFRTFHESLNRLGLGYVDILYVHWPIDAYEEFRTLTAFGELRQQGFIDRIGISNFTPEMVLRTVTMCDVTIDAIQLECHPLFPQFQLRSICEENGIQPVAYSPLARGRILDFEPVVEIADSMGVSPAQVSLSWLRQQGVPAVPKPAVEEHVVDNWESLNVQLDNDAVERLNDIKQRVRVINPPNAPWK